MLSRQIHENFKSFEFVLYIPENVSGVIALEIFVEVMRVCLFLEAFVWLMFTYLHVYICTIRSILAPQNVCL